MRCSEDLALQIEEALRQNIILLDFSAVNHIDLAGFALLIDTWLKAKEENLIVLAIGVKKDLELLMRLHRVWDLIKPHLFRNAEEVIASIQHKGQMEPFFEALVHEGDHMVLTLFGKLDRHKNCEQLLQKYLPSLQELPCVIDLTHCTGVDNTGISFLMRLREQIPHSFSLRNPTKSVQNQLK